MRYKCHFWETSSCKRLLLCDKIGCPPGDISSNAGPFTGKDRYFLLADLFFCPRFTSRTNAFHTIDLECKILGYFLHDQLLFSTHVDHIPNGVVILNEGTKQREKRIHSVHELSALNENRQMSLIPSACFEISDSQRLFLLSLPDRDASV